MQIDDKINELKKQFDRLSTWEQKYEKIIELGKKWPGLADEYKTEDLKVKGCQSQVWIRAELSADKKIIFTGDSDALLVKGLVALALSVYSNETPQTILSKDPTFLSDLGFDKGLSPSRSNGLYSMIKQIKYYATAFQYLLSK
ncbi:MAG: SufE family protein [Bdellovibrio sp.]|nr:SufE family protein [Bdellovibrio sp.]